MATKWTIEQKKAIEEHGGNILVSAAAGSGKTAVLIERILTIIKEKTDIDKMLIVTFTKAAAAEIRERLYASLQKELDSDDISPSVARRLARQQRLLSKSYITTIDAFCKNVISSNPVESGLDASFRLADSGEIAVIQAEVLENVLERRYKENSPEFLHLADSLGSYKSDAPFENQIMSIFNFSLSYPEPEMWLAKQKETFDIGKIKDFTETAWCKELLKDLYVNLEAKSEELYRCLKTSEKYGIAEYEKMFSQDYNMLKELTAFLKEVNDTGCDKYTWEEIFARVSGLSFNKAAVIYKKALEEYDDKTIEQIEELKKSRKNCREKVVEITSKKMGGTHNAPLEDIRLVQQDIFVLLDIAAEFSAAFRKKKREKHLMTFDDITHGAYNVLSARDEDGALIQSEVAKGYSKLFEEVYIDEYQDTNELQDAILYLVSRNFKALKEEVSMPNMFMVGDVKQSIYGFRQARPDIFMGKYKSFGKGMNQGKLIVLNKNFRSRQGVIDSVNNLFSKIMTDNTCGIDYTEAEYLNFGAEHYPKTPENELAELYITEGDDKFEAEFIAQKIKLLIDGRFKVFDKNTKEMRPAQYRDIVILLRSPGGTKKVGRVYVQALAKLGIPAYSPESNGFFSNAEINILLSFMKVIDNPIQDVHFVATMRNIYGFSDSNIAAVRNINKRQKTSFYEACKKYSEEGKNEELRNNVKKFVNRIDELRVASRHLTVSELLWQLMHENHFYENLASGPMGELHLANANVLLARAIKYDGEVNKGLFRFLYFFDSLKKRSDMNEATAASEGMNVVRILSIHKSKGLEFPIVILGNTSKIFNKLELNDSVLKHRLLGLGPTCYLEAERVKYPTVMKNCVARRIAADSKAEEMRILYVAMTRAAEKLIITGAVDDTEKYLMQMNSACSLTTGRPLENNIIEAKSFLDWIVMSKCINPDCIHLLKKEKTENAENTQETSAITEIKVIPQPEMTFYMQEDDESTNKMPAKISVSELKRIAQEQARDPEADLHPTVKKIEMKPIPDLLDPAKTKLTAAQKGTAVHTCLQLTEYKRLINISEEEAIKYFEEVILEAQDKGFLDKDEAESVDRSIMARFYTGSLARRISQADMVMKEIPFTLLEEINAERVAVQGVIDCVIKEGERFTVIDFKTDEVPDANKYKAQLEYYAAAIKKIFGADAEKIVYFIKFDKQELL